MLGFKLKCQGDKTTQCPNGKLLIQLELLVFQISFQTSQTFWQSQFKELCPWQKPHQYPLDMIDYLLAREGTKLNKQNIMTISFNDLCLYGQGLWSNESGLFYKKRKKGKIKTKKYWFAFEKLNVCLNRMWYLNNNKNGRFSIHLMIIQGETSSFF